MIKRSKIFGEADKKLGTHTSILADLQGPKLRVGKIEGDNLELVEGNEILFTTKEVEAGSAKLYITYPDFAKDVKVGERILLDDGKLALEVSHTDNKHEVKGQSNTRRHIKK